MRVQPSKLFLNAIHLKTIQVLADAEMPACDTHAEVMQSQNTEKIVI